MSKQDQNQLRRGSALVALAVAWAQGKLQEHPPRLGWADLAIVCGLVACWLLGVESKGAKK